MSDMPKQTLLELIQDDDGALLLREAKDKSEVLVSIHFSDKVKDMLGDDVQYVGEHMIHAAMAAVMKQQMEKWHANVFDEEPRFYS